MTRLSGAAAELPRFGPRVTAVLALGLGLAPVAAQSAMQAAAPAAAPLRRDAQSLSRPVEDAAFAAAPFVGGQWDQEKHDRMDIAVSFVDGAGAVGGWRSGARGNRSSPWARTHRGGGGGAGGGGGGAPRRLIRHGDAGGGGGGAGRGRGEGRGLAAADGPGADDVEEATSEEEVGELEEVAASGAASSWPSLLELQRGRGPDDALVDVEFRRRGGQRRRRGVTSIIGDYPFDGALGGAKTGIWRPAYARGLSHEALYLNNPSRTTIDIRKAERRYESNNSFLQLPRVSKTLDSYALMFDFKFLGRRARKMRPEAADLLQFTAPEANGLAFRTFGLGFGVSPDGKALKFAGQALAHNIKGRWIHVGLTARSPCQRNSTLKVFIDGQIRTSLKEAGDLFDVCDKTPFVNLHCWDHGLLCSAQLEMLLDNVWTIEDYIPARPVAKHLQKIEDDGSDIMPLSFRSPAAAPAATIFGVSAASSRLLLLAAAWAVAAAAAAE